MTSKKAIDDKHEKIIRQLLREPDNRRCLNCTNNGPQYVCVTFGIFVCTACSGVHREFNHRIKSVSMASFTPEEVKELQKGANKAGKRRWFASWTQSDFPLPDGGASADRRQDFIRTVYVNRRFEGKEESAGSSGGHQAGGSEAGGGSSGANTPTFTRSNTLQVPAMAPPPTLPGPSSTTSSTSSITSLQRSITTAATTAAVIPPAPSTLPTTTPTTPASHAPPPQEAPSLIDFSSPPSNAPESGADVAATASQEKPSPGSSLSANLFQNPPHTLHPPPTSNTPANSTASTAASWTAEFPVSASGAAGVSSNQQWAGGAVATVGGGGGWAAFDQAPPVVVPPAVPAALPPAVPASAPPAPQHAVGNTGGGWAAFSDPPPPPPPAAPSAVDPFAASVTNSQDLLQQHQQQPAVASDSRDGGRGESWATFNSPPPGGSADVAAPSGGSSGSVAPPGSASREVLPEDLFSEPELTQTAPTGAAGANSHMPNGGATYQFPNGSGIYNSGPATAATTSGIGVGQSISYQGGSVQAGYLQQQQHHQQGGGAFMPGTMPHHHQGAFPEVMQGGYSASPGVHNAAPQQFSTQYMHSNQGAHLRTVPSGHGYNAAPPQMMQSQAYQQQLPQYQQYPHQAHQQYQQHPYQQQYQHQQYQPQYQQYNQPVQSPMPVPQQPQVHDVFSGLTDLKASLPSTISPSASNAVSTDSPAFGFGGFSVSGGINNVSMPPHSGMPQVTSANFVAQQGMQAKQNTTSTNPFA